MSKPEAPIKFTVDALTGVRDAWVTFASTLAAQSIAQATATIEQFAEKLPEPIKSKLPLNKLTGKSDTPAEPPASSGANAPS